MPKKSTPGAITDQAADEVAWPNVDTSTTTTTTTSTSTTDTDIDKAIATPPDDDEALFAKLRIDQSYTDPTFGVRKPLTTVPVRRPPKTEWFRVHPTNMIDVPFLELKDKGESYFCTNEIAAIVGDVAVPVRLRQCVTRQGTTFLWPIKLPRGNKRADAWHTSAAEAAALGVKRWIRLVPDMELGAYQPLEALGINDEPKWPAESWAHIFRVATRDLVIDTDDHVVVREILGQG